MTEDTYQQINQQIRSHLPSLLLLKAMRWWHNLRGVHLGEGVLLFLGIELLRYPSRIYIGAHAVILSGVTIADGAIIAAGSVVRENVDKDTIVGSVPSKVIGVRS